MTELIHVYSTDHGSYIGHRFYCTKADGDEITGQPFKDIEAIGADMIIRLYRTASLRESDKLGLEKTVKQQIARDPKLLEALGDHWHL